MKLKYYLRGLGIGIIITTIILMISYSGRKAELTNEEIIQRAEALGMVMEEDKLFFPSATHNNTEVVKESELIEDTERTTEQETERVTETEHMEETEAESEQIADSETEIQEVEERETYQLNIPPGSVPRLICNELEEKGVIEKASSLRQYLVEMDYAKSIKPGNYDIPYGASNEEIYQILKAGPK